MEEIHTVHTVWIGSLFKGCVCVDLFLGHLFVQSERGEVLSAQRAVKNCTSYPANAAITAEQNYSPFLFCVGWNELAYK